MLKGENYEKKNGDSSKLNSGGNSCNNFSMYALSKYDTDRK